MKTRQSPEVVGPAPKSQVPPVQASPLMAAKTTALRKMVAMKMESMKTASMKASGKRLSRMEKAFGAQLPANSPRSKLFFRRIDLPVGPAGLLQGGHSTLTTDIQNEPHPDQHTRQ